MSETQMIILALKAHAFEEIRMILADPWEYGDDKKAAVHTLFEINGIIQMADRIMRAFATVEKGAEDE